MLRALKFYETVQIAPWKHLTKRTYRHSACTDSAKTYELNLMRVHALATVPGYAFMSGERWQEAGRMVTEGYPSLDRKSEECSNRTRMAFEAILSLYDEGERNEKFRESSFNADCICSLVPSIYDGFKAALQSMVTQAWTAFEVLSEELNDGARARHPECFSAAVLAKKYKYRQLPSLFKAYEVAFSNDAGISAALINAKVKALGLLRHLLVHKSGKVDQMFLDQCADVPVVTCFSAFGLSTEVFIEGAMVRSLVDPVTECAYELIGLVDSWLTAREPI